MIFHILSLFPEMVSNGLQTSIIGKAVENNLIQLNTVNIRDFSKEKHGKVDDYTYGGGAGMLMQAQPVYDSWKSICGSGKIRTVYVTPQGAPFTQKMAQDFAEEEELIILCGHYEGIDERVLEETVTDYVSIGDYVLTGGELAAMVIVDAVSRLVPGVLGNETSADTESFHCDLLEYPQYSRPEVWHDKEVPKVLMSGNHQKIVEWRLEQSVARTKERRPDLYIKYDLKQKAIKLLSNHKRDNIHMIETLKRGMGEILYWDKEDILIYDESSKLAQLSVTNPDVGKKLLKLVPASVESFEISQEFMVDILMKEHDMHVDMACFNACYTNRELQPVPHKEMIKPLTMEHFDYVYNHYGHGNREYVMDRITKGKMYGIFPEGEIAGFVGEHEEGSIGLLFIDPEFRRRGFGDSLEAFMINKHRMEGYIPYGQIELTNEISLKLQESKGLYISAGKVWWMSAGDKWQAE